MFTETGLGLGCTWVVFVICLGFMVVVMVFEVGNDVEWVRKLAPLIFFGTLLAMCEVFYGTIQYYYIVHAKRRRDNGSLRVRPPY